MVSRMKEFLPNFNYLECFFRNDYHWKHAPIWIKLIFVGAILNKLTYLLHKDQEVHYECMYVLHAAWKKESLQSSPGSRPHSATNPHPNRKARESNPINIRTVSTSTWRRHLLRRMRPALTEQTDSSNSNCRKKITNSKWRRLRGDQWEGSVVMPTVWAGRVISSIGMFVVFVLPDSKALWLGVWASFPLRVARRRARYAFGLNHFTLCTVFLCSLRNGDPHISVRLYKFSLLE